MVLFQHHLKGMFCTYVLIGIYVFIGMQPVCRTVHKFFVILSGLTAMLCFVSGHTVWIHKSFLSDLTTEVPPVHVINKSSCED